MTSYPQKPGITNYGAVTKLVDAFPVKDPSSELSATFINPIRNDLTAVCQVAPIARMQIAGTTGIPVITGSTTWSTGQQYGWFSGTAVAFTRNSTGNITCTLPTTVQDFAGNLGIPVNVTDVAVRVFGFASSSAVTINSSNQFTFQLYTLVSGSYVTTDYVGALITLTVY